MPTDDEIRARHKALIDDAWHNGPLLVALMSRPENFSDDTVKALFSHPDAWVRNEAAQKLAHRVTPEMRQGQAGDQITDSILLQRYWHAVTPEEHGQVLQEMLARPTLKTNAALSEPVLKNFWSGEAGPHRQQIIDTFGWPTLLKEMTRQGRLMPLPPEEARQAWDVASRERQAAAGFDAFDSQAASKHAENVQRLLLRHQATALPESAFDQAIQDPALSGEALQTTPHLRHRLDAIRGNDVALARRALVDLDGRPLPDEVLNEALDRHGHEIYRSLTGADVYHDPAIQKRLAEMSLTDPNAHRGGRAAVAVVDDLENRRYRGTRDDILRLLTKHPDEEVQKRLLPHLQWIDPDALAKDRVDVRWGTNKLRQIRDLIRERGVDDVSPKELPAGNWSVGRIPNGNISAKRLQEVIDSAPPSNYNVTHSEYDGSQMHTNEPSKVFQLNLTNDHVEQMKKAGVYDTFRKMYAASKQSGHPVGPAGIGWLRWTGDQKGIHIDEVQSDFGQSFVKQARAQARQQGQNEDEAGDKAEAEWPEKHQQAINDILFQGHHPSEVLQEAFQEWLRQPHKESTWEEEEVASLPVVCPKCKSASWHERRGLMPGNPNDPPLGYSCGDCGKYFRTHDWKQVDRDVSYVGTPIHIWQPESKAKISLSNPDAKLPGHFYVGYRDVPKKLGWKPGEYGELETQYNSRYKGKGRDGENILACPHCDGDEHAPARDNGEFGLRCLKCNYFGPSESFHRPVPRKPGAATWKDVVRKSEGKFPPAALMKEFVKRDLDPNAGYEMRFEPLDEKYGWVTVHHGGQQVGQLDVGRSTSQPGSLFPVSVEVDAKHRRRGVATAMYQHAEKVLGAKFIPGHQNASSRALWKQKNRPFGKSEDPHPPAAVSVLVQNEAGQVLWGRRQKDGRWTLPGGHLEPGEEPGVAAVRELWEEAGIEASAIHHFGTANTDAGLPLYMFRAWATGEPQSGNDPDFEVAEWRWVDCLMGVPPEILGNLAHPRNLVVEHMGWSTGQTASGTMPVMAKTEDSGVNIAARIRSLRLNGFGGACFDAAHTINQQVFGGRGRVVGMANAFWLDRGRFLGHVAVEHGGKFWDTDARPKDYGDIADWGALDTEDPTYQADGWGPEAADGVVELDGHDLHQAWHSAQRGSSRPRVGLENSDIGHDGVTKDMVKAERGAWYKQQMGRYGIDYRDPSKYPAQYDLAQHRGDFTTLIHQHAQDDLGCDAWADVPKVHPVVHVPVSELYQDAVAWGDDEERGPAHVDAMAESMRRGVPLPPVVVGRYGTDRRGLIDGRHRTLAAHKLGLKTVPAISFDDPNWTSARRPGHDQWKKTMKKAERPDIRRFWQLYCRHQPRGVEVQVPTEQLVRHLAASNMRPRYENGQPQPVSHMGAGISGQDRWNGLVEDVKRNGIRTPIEVIERDGKPYFPDGLHRLGVAQHLGLPTVPVTTTPALAKRHGWLIGQATRE